MKKKQLRQFQVSMRRNVVLEVTTIVDAYSLAEAKTLCEFGPPPDSEDEWGEVSGSEPRIVSCEDIGPA